MLDKLTIRNFKRFDEVEIELGNPVVFIGPNNSGKTSALQALALWDVGLKKWLEKRAGGKTPEKRPGVTINRRDLVSVPLPNANLLWRGLHVRDTQRINGKQDTKNVNIEITVDGYDGNQTWKCGLEFVYANDESFYCSPLRIKNGKNLQRMPIPAEANRVQLSYLPPMSGLAANETKLERGAINVRIGEGRTAEVLRNLCYSIYAQTPQRWEDVARHIKSLFGVALNPPEYIEERGEIDMSYEERKVVLDLSASGRGLQQTLLILTYMYANPGSILLLDEPDAHLEILRQRQIYQLLIDVANENRNQIIAASHSEVLLNEAADRDVVIAFIGKPHRIDDRGSQLLKALKEIGFEHYYQAELKGWVLYLEGSTDLAILRAFAKKTGNSKALEALERPFVYYVANNLNQAKKHFYGIREAYNDIKAIALLDRDIGQGEKDNADIMTYYWKKREIESYLCIKETLIEFVKAPIAYTAGPLFDSANASRAISLMENTIDEIEKYLIGLDRGSPWDGEMKVSDEFLTPLFKNYYKKLGTPNIMEKANFHKLADFVPADRIDPEINQALDKIVSIADSGKPLHDED